MNEDQITALYNQSGKAFRDSRVGKLVKSAITSDTTKKLRDLAIDKIGFQEHEKRFIQHLTGGTVGNKPITELPEKLITGLSIAHARGDYPELKETIPSKHYGKMVAAAEQEAALTGDSSSFKSIVHGDGAMVPNPNYNPDSKLLSTYGSPGTETAWTLGHVQMTENPDGSLRMTDTYDVDSNISMGDEKYVPLIGERSDLIEGTKRIKMLGREYDIPLASRAHDISVWLGVNQDMRFDVNIPKEKVDTWNKVYGKKSEGL
tara:strand:- start:335 stop:1117 length:783 start_codon:yes stop_codon:yes gene_type:complete